MGIGFAQLRDLDTSKLTTAADTSVAVGKDMETRAGDIADAARNGSDGSWAGADATAQNTLLGTFPAPLNAAGSVFKNAAGTIDALVIELSAAKSDVETAISSYPRHTVGDDGSVSWPPTDNAADAKLLAEQGAALSQQLTAALERANTADDSAAKRLQDDNPGQAPVETRLPDGRVVLTTDDKNNTIKISNDAEGNLIANVDGKEYKYDPGTALTVYSRGGDDDITVDKSVNNDIVVDSGADNDTVTDSGSQGPRSILTGEGQDKVTVSGDGKTVDTGVGNDTVKATGDGNTIATADGDDSIDITGAGTAHGGADNDDIRVGTAENPKGPTTVHGDEGDDEIHGSDNNDKLFGGAGDDKVYGHGGNDEMHGEAGYDYLDGQNGDDTIHGGTEKDTIYGLDGKDTLYGDQGRDYLEGGADNDTLDGGTEEDVLSGGKGDDILNGGDHNDRIYAGDGKDTVDGGAGDDDQVFAQQGDVVNGETTEKYTETKVVDSGHIKIEGSEDFVKRTRADLDMLGASPTGQQMLQDLGNEIEKSKHDDTDGERVITIKEYEGDNGFACPTREINTDTMMCEPGEDDGNQHASVKVNPTFHLTDPSQPDDEAAYREGVPSTVLYHELAHVYDFTHETSAEGDDPGGNSVNSERQAAGLDYDWNGDGKRDDVRSPDNPHPYVFTENAMRDEMGRDHRDQY